MEPDPPILSLHMGPSRRWMAAYYPSIDYEAYHNVWFWALLLRHKRRYAGRALPVALDNDLLRNARSIYRNWWVSQRYRSEVPAL